ncbi:MAG TPA: sulfotransferase [Gemmataceae bacterium]|nr:sulfotransferase [Gemmataceae bacterium]
MKIGAWFRRRLRGYFFSLLRRISETDDGRAIVADGLKGLLRWRPVLGAGGQEFTESPYPELGGGQQENRAAKRRDVVIISGRFRSGSTLLWNIFRHIEGCVAFYEPFNERRWFDPSLRGERVDPTHKQVENYWKEYDGLEHLGDYYKEEWTYRNLYMDEEFWNPGMKRYIDLLINKTTGRPVLQFNRIDFRLPWIRHHYPLAKIIHLYRHPRDQWCSALLDLKRFGKDESFAEFAVCDDFYLLNWARDLKYHFPFLDQEEVSNPYQLFYYIWKLSYLFGRRYSDYSICFEHLVSDPPTELQALFSVVEIEHYELTQLKQLIMTPGIGRWKNFADPEWFQMQESVCEAVLAEFFSKLRD